MTRTRLKLRTTGAEVAGTLRVVRRRGATKSRSQEGCDFGRLVASLAQVEKQLDEQTELLRRIDAGLSGLDELLDELRAQSQAIFILIDRLPPP